MESESWKKAQVRADTLEYFQNLHVIFQYNLLIYFYSLLILRTVAYILTFASGKVGWEICNNAILLFLAVT